MFRFFTLKKVVIYICKKKKFKKYLTQQLRFSQIINYEMKRTLRVFFFSLKRRHLSRRRRPLVASPGPYGYDANEMRRINPHTN